MGYIPRTEGALDRRQFMTISAAAGGGLMLSLALPRKARAKLPAFGNEIDDKDVFTAWVTISPDNIVTCRVHHSEMGQGSSTGLPMLIIEELDVPFEQVRWEHAPNGQVWRNRGFTSGMQNTGGSTSHWGSWVHLREAGAMAREMLRMAAATRWEVPLAEVSAKAGQLTHAPSGRTLSYGDVAGDAARLDPPADIALKDPAEWTLIGTSPARLDLPAKVDGSAVFGSDVQVDDMLVATVKACPVFGGRLEALDTAPAKAVKGVVDVVTTEKDVIVIAEGYWPAKKGLDALAPQWSSPHAVSDADVMAALDKGVAQDTNIAVERGTVEAALEQAATVIEADYAVPYMAHACLEPMNTTVDPRGDTVQVWSPTQNQTITAGAVAEVFGDGRPVFVHTTLLGGGFGRRGRDDYVRQAAEAAKAVGRPVKLLWSREEDFAQDYYRPAVKARVRAGLDAEGKPVAMHGRLANQSLIALFNPRFLRDGVDPTSVEGFSSGPYTEALAHVRVSSDNTDLPTPIGFWRAVGYTQTGFFMETLVDEMAHAAGRDPLEFRLAWLEGAPRDKALLERVAEMADYGAERPAKHGLGISVIPSYGSRCAMIMEVSVEGEKRLKMHRLWAAIDPGFALHPDMVRQQVEGGAVWALTAALFGEMKMEGGAMPPVNFDTHRMITLAETPVVETAIINGGMNERGLPGGVGEVGTPPAFAALTNAVFAASGERIRALPMTRAGWDLAV